GPVTVEVKKIMIGPASGPWLVMFYSHGGSIKRSSLYLVVPVHIAVAAIGIHSRIHDHYHILQPFLLLCHKFVNGFHCSFGAGSLIAMHVITKPYNCFFGRGTTGTFNNSGVL